MYYKNGTRFDVALKDQTNHSIANHNLTININGQNYTRTTDSDGKTSLAINLNPGKYLADVYFLGSDKYLKSTTKSNITVLPTIHGEDIVKYYRNDTQYLAHFVDGYGDDLINENVTFNINGVLYTRTTNQNGIAKLNINLNSGEYILTAINPYDGYLYSNAIKVLSTVNGSDLYKVYRDVNQYRATFVSGSGNPLKNTDVKFNVNGVLYTRKSDADGIAKLNINLNPGKYVLTSYNPVTSEAHSSIINVYSYSSTSLASKNQSFKANDDDTIKAVLTNRFNYGISGENITVTVNNKTYSILTDENGIASFNLNLTQGNYSLTFNYVGSDKYNVSECFSQVEVYDGIRTYLTGQNRLMYKDNIYNVTLLDADRKALANETVYFIFNSKIYSNTTDDNGIAGFSVNAVPGVYKIEYIFNKTNYKFHNGVSEILVISTNKTSITPLTSDVVEGVGDKLKVNLTVGGVKLANRNVIFEINGKNYTKVTGNDGVASLTINLNAGNYEVKYYYSGETGLESTNNSSLLNVTPRIQTTLTSLAASVIRKAVGITFKVQLNATSALSDKVIIFTIGSSEYSVLTDSEGIASLDISDLNTGSYSVSYRFDGDRIYSKSSGISQLKIDSKIAAGYSYWVRYNHMNSLDLAALSKQGTNHIFLHSYVFTAYGSSNVIAWIKKANSYGMQVHIWMQVFYNNGKWVAPVNSDGSFKYSYFNTKINEAKYYAGISGVSGVHFDYLRFGGTAYKHINSKESINYFVKQVSSAVRSVQPNCILSAAVMPEPNTMIYYYGQDIPTISRYLDVIVPMVYKGNYGKDTSWIQQTTRWFVDNSNGAQIWTGLQTYNSDSDITKLSYSNLFRDAQASLNGGAKGVVMFRWGVTNFINFNDLVI